MDTDDLRAALSAMADEIDANDPVRVAEVVDRRALGLQARHQRLDDRVADRGALGAGQRVGRPPRMDPGIP